MAASAEDEAGATAGGKSSDSESPGDVMDLLKQFDFLSIEVGGKIYCKLTGRDLPLRVDAIKQHVNSKKLKKEREWYKADFTKYEPLIVPHKTNPKMLFCKLTGIELNRIPKQVEAHVNGRKFLNRKAEAEAEMAGAVAEEEAAKLSASEDGDFWALTGDDNDNVGARREDVDGYASMGEADGIEEEEATEDGQTADVTNTAGRGMKGDQKVSESDAGTRNRVPGKGARKSKKSGRSRHGEVKEPRGNGVSKGDLNEGAKSVPKAPDHARSKRRGERKSVEAQLRARIPNGGTSKPSSGESLTVSNTEKSALTQYQGKDRERGRSKSRTAKGAGKSGVSNGATEPKGAQASPSSKTGTTKRKQNVAAETTGSGKKKRLI